MQKTLKLLKNKLTGRSNIYLCLLVKEGKRLPHSHKRQKVSLGTRSGLAVLRPYVESQSIAEPILIGGVSKRKQTKGQESGDCLWTHIFTFF